jgi:hypothetical protein
MGSPVILGEVAELVLALQSPLNERVTGWNLHYD